MRITVMALADAHLGGQLKEILSGYQDAGLSLDQQAIELSARLPMSVSREAIRRWSKKLGVPTARERVA